MLAANNKQGVIYGTHISFEQFEDTNSLYLNQSHQLLMNLSMFVGSQPTLYMTLTCLQILGKYASNKNSISASQTVWYTV